MENNRTRSNEEPNNTPDAANTSSTSTLQPSFNIPVTTIGLKDIQEEAAKLIITSEVQGEVAVKGSEKQSDKGFEEDMPISPELKLILETQKKIKALKSKPIRFSEAVMTQNSNPVIFPHTINVIQGQAGVHKSRLAEMMCSAFLKKADCSSELLGFKRNQFDANHTVLYVDTERNITEQFPYALQSIQLKAGYSIEDEPAKLDFITLLEISRKRRFAALNDYLNYLKSRTNNPLFIVLDVSTDCIEDFNKTDKSMELIDLMNMVINEHNVIFLCLIHENPKSDKARGHFGTELMNKASTVMQVGFEKDANQNDTNMIRVKYLKCRSTERQLPFYMKYCSEAKGLVLADAEEINQIKEGKKHKASLDDMIDVLEKLLGNGQEMAKSELMVALKTETAASVRTIEDRLVSIIESELIIADFDGQECLLAKEMKSRIIFFKLVPIPSSVQ
jgi:hypothetical protein